MNRTRRAMSLLAMMVTACCTSGCAFITHDTFLVMDDPSIRLIEPRFSEDRAPLCVVPGAVDSMVYVIAGPLDQCYALLSLPLIPIPVVPNLFFPIQLGMRGIGRPADNLLWIEVSAPHEGRAHWWELSAQSADGVLLQIVEARDWYPMQQPGERSRTPGPGWRAGCLFVLTTSQAWQPPLRVTLPPVTMDGRTVPGPTIQMQKRSKWRYMFLG